MNLQFRFEFHSGISDKKRMVMPVVSLALLEASIVCVKKSFVGCFFGFFGAGGEKG